MKGPRRGPVTPLILSPWFMEPWSRFQITTVANVSSAWTANRAVFFPIIVPETCTITKMGWQNGTTAAGNIDVGFYTADGRRLGSTGSTAQSGTSVWQSVDVTDFVVPAGTVFMAIATDSGSSTFWSVNQGIDLKSNNWYVQSSSFPLPAAAAAFSAASGSIFLPKFAALVSPRTVF